jgi:hypothetical protein
MKAEEQAVFKGNLSIRTEKGELKDFISGNFDETNFFYDGTKTLNSLGTTVKNSSMKGTH